MGAPLIHRPVNDYIYAYQLSSAYRSPWVYAPNYFDVTDADAWEMIRQDGDMLAAIQKRNNAIVRPWRVAPNYHASFNTDDKKVVDASKRLASIAHEGLSHIVRFDASRRVLSQAFYLGRSYGRTIWEEMEMSLDGTPAKKWFIPIRIQDVDRRRMHWVADWKWVKSTGKTVQAGSRYQMDSALGGGSQVQSQMPYTKGGYMQKTGIHLEMYNTDSYRWEPITPEARRNFIEYIYYDTEDRVGHGRGVLEAGMFIHFFKANTFKRITEGIDRYANGMLIGTLDSVRNADITQTNEDLRQAMMDVLIKMRSEHVVVLQDGDNIEIKEPSGKGFDVSLQFLRYLAESWERLCNGAVRQSGHSVDGTGAKAAAQQEGETAEEFYQPDRNDLDNILDRDLLGAFLYHNEHNIAELGLQDAKRPKFTSEQIKRQEPEKAITIIQGALNSNMPILKTEAYDRLEFTPPGPDDEVIEPKIALAGQGLDEFGRPFEMDKPKDEKDGKKKGGDKKKEGDK